MVLLRDCPKKCMCFLAHYTKTLTSLARFSMVEVIKNHFKFYFLTLENEQVFKNMREFNSVHYFGET